MNCSSPSLKLLEMPWLCKKLGFNRDGSNERVTGVEDYGYRDGVLVGNWFERRCEKQSRDERHLTTTYQEDYQPRSPDESDPQNVWPSRLQAEGTLKLDDCEEKEGNAATVYDLAYRCKVRDFVSGDYGNVTGYGKKECKQRYWASQQDNRSARYHTEYADSYRHNGPPCLTHINS